MFGSGMLFVLLNLNLSRWESTESWLIFLRERREFFLKNFCLLHGTESGKLLRENSSSIFFPSVIPPTWESVRVFWAFFRAMHEFREIRILFYWVNESLNVTDFMPSTFTTFHQFYYSFQRTSQYRKNMVKSRKKRVLTFTSLFLAWVLSVFSVCLALTLVVITSFLKIHQLSISE